MCLLVNVRYWEAMPSSPRTKSVAAFARRCDCDIRHSEHVARLAGRIFDQTSRLHALRAECRELLKHAALLHEVGLHVSDRGYHKHSYYLIRHAPLRGFNEEQLDLIANVARYHRKSTPSEGHSNLAQMTPAQRADVEKLSAILRIAEGLDRTHRQAVRDVAIRVDRRVRFAVRAHENATAEIAAARKRARYFAELFNLGVTFEVA